MSAVILGTGYLTRSPLSYPFLSHLTGHPLKTTVNFTGTQLEALKILPAETELGMYYISLYQRAEECNINGLLSLT